MQVAVQPFSLFQLGAAPRQPVPRQDCTHCRNLQLCWRSQLDRHAIVINLLTCRIERSINPNRSARALLRMIRPKLKKTADRIRRVVGDDGYVDIGETIRELESAVIENLMEHYRMGERMHPLRWLFGKPHGAIRRWAAHRVHELKREALLTVSYGSATDETTQVRASDSVCHRDFVSRLARLNFVSTGHQVHSPPADLIKEPEEYDTNAAFRANADSAQRVIDDGLTLPLAEYRVLKFCLSNANETSAKPTTGLHRYIAHVTDTPRSIVTWRYGQALRRLLDATGQAPDYLRRRGLSLPNGSSAYRRERWRLQLPPSKEAISAKEVADMIETRAQPGVTALDVAWIYGVSVDLVYRLQRRFRDYSRQQIYEACSV
jgi:hypothetical protein